MLAEATEILQSGQEQPVSAPVETPSRPGVSPAAAGFQKSGAGIEFTAFLLVMVIVVLYCWPTAEDQALLESAVLYAAVLNSN